MTDAPPGTLRVATRRSALARAQSTAVGERLAGLTGRALELVEITTTGDVDQGPLAQIGGTGVFVTAVRQAVIDGRADVAVHSLKDLPTAPDERLELAAIPRRADPRDALVARAGATLATLPTGARIGTGSPRRRAQVLAARPDVEVVDIRGNVDTRVARVLGGERQGGASGADLDAVVLAVAGLDRLGRSAQITEHLDPATMVPAPGQGALAVEVRAGSTLADAVRAIDDARTRAAVVAERSLLRGLEAGCSAPVGALGVVTDEGAGEQLRLSAVMARADGSLVRGSATGPAADAEQLGGRLAGELLAAGDLEPGRTRPLPAGDRPPPGVAPRERDRTPTDRTPTDRTHIDRTHIDRGSPNR